MVDMKQKGNDLGLMLGRPPNRIFILKKKCVKMLEDSLKLQNALSLLEM
jgi:hypothetical protein